MEEVRSLPSGVTVDAGGWRGQTESGKATTISEVGGADSETTTAASKATQPNAEALSTYRPEGREPKTKRP